MLNSSISASLLWLPLATQPAFAANAEMTRPPSIAKTAARGEGDLCHVEAAKRYIGSASTAEIRTAIAKSVGHTLIRWIRPGEAVTQDYREDRLNIILNDDGRILTMRCG